MLKKHSFYTVFWERSTWSLPPNWVEFDGHGLKSDAAKVGRALSENIFNPINWLSGKKIKQENQSGGNSNH